MPEENTSMPEDPTIHSTIVNHGERLAKQEVAIASIAKTTQALAETVGKLPDQINAGLTRVYERMDHHEQRNIEADRERTKVPYPLLTLIFSVMISIGGVLVAYMHRIDTDAKERHVQQDVALQREMRLLNVGIDKQQARDHERINKVEQQTRDYQSMSIDQKARIEERVKILYELRNQDLNRTQ